KGARRCAHRVVANGGRKTVPLNYSANAKPGPDCASLALQKNKGGLLLKPREVREHANVAILLVREEFTLDQDESRGLRGFLGKDFYAGRPCSNREGRECEKQ